MAIYTLASLYYYVRSRSVGTPFNDSLTPKQREIKKESVAVRRSLFYQGIAIALGAMVLFKPFKACNCKC
jgi:hypothetical protein